MQNWITRYPAIPERLFKEFERHAGRAVTLDWKVSPGQHVRSGQTIATYSVPPIKVKENIFKSRQVVPAITMPVDGRIYSRENKPFAKYPDYKNWDEFRKDVFRIAADPKYALFAVQPDGEYASLGVYGPYYSIVDYAYHIPGHDHFDTNEISPDKFQFHYNMVTNMYASDVIPLTPSK